LRVSSVEDHRSPLAARRTYLPGLAAAIAIAVSARLLAGFLPPFVAEVTIAILLGVVVAQIAGSRAAALNPGLELAVQRVLRLGIVFLGARLSLDEIARIGLPATGVIAVTMVAAFAIVLLASRLIAVERELSVLLAVGSAVCGNSAIVATAPVIGARASHVGYAVATVTLFGTAAVFVYPVVGHAIRMPDADFGLWSGIAVNDTSQVIAASAAYSAGALDVATVVKLIRNALMAPLLLLIGWGWARQRQRAGAVKADLRRAVPLFVLGFLAMAGLQSVGLIGDREAEIFDALARTLILVALAAVGLSVRFSELRATSWRPFAIGFSAAIAVGAGTLLAIAALGVAKQAWL
jgi:uncharacterized integral membrane protein (TIGR00698 family)